MNRPIGLFPAESVMALKARHVIVGAMPKFELIRG
jgi:hypothetical protein